LGRHNRYIAAKGKTSYIIDSAGHVHKWPNPDAKDKDDLFKPKLIEMRNHKTRFVNISCGLDFIIGISNSN